MKTDIEKLRLQIFFQPDEVPSWIGWRFRFGAIGMAKWFQTKYSILLKNLINYFIKN